MPDTDTSNASDSASASRSSDRASDARDSLSDKARDALSGRDTTAKGNDMPATPEDRISGQDRLAATGQPAKGRMERQLKQAREPAAFAPTPPPDTFAHDIREGAAAFTGRRIGEAQAVAGFAGDMVGGAVAAVETGYEAAVVGVETATGVVPDAYAAAQQADLIDRRDAFMAAAEELLTDPVGVAEAIAESYEARFAQADALEAAYQSGHGDLSVLREAERIRGEATAELAIMGVETAAIAAGGVGAVAKALRAARIADRVDGATPIAMAMAQTQSARIATAEVLDLARQPGRTEPFSAAMVAERVRNVESGATRGQLDYYQWEAAEVVYDEIRSLDAAADVRQIAENTGLSEADIAIAREHIFFDEHALDAGIKRFDANPNMANAWHRLQDGTFNQNDLALIAHERFEADLMRNTGMNYRGAHQATVDAGFIWEDLP